MPLNLHAYCAKCWMALVLMLALALTAASIALCVVQREAVQSVCDPDYIRYYRPSFVITMTASGSVVGLVTAVVFYACRLQKRTKVAIVVGTIGGVACGVFAFSLVFIVSAFPAISPVSLCYAFRPWWRPLGWVLFLSAVAICTAGFVGATLSLWPSSPKDSGGQEKRT